MCGRSSLFTNQAFLEDRFDATATEPIPQRYNIAPGDEQAVITNDRPDDIDLIELGFTPVWDEEQRLINARSESAAEKRTFSKSFKERRCLVLADGFYEWKGSRGSKRPYRIQLPENEPFAFAGLWQPYEDGEKHRQVTILTCEPNETLEPIHDRMPVMLEDDEEERWLQEENVDELQSLLDPYPDRDLEAYEISTKINNPEYHSVDVLEPLDVGEQSGLGEF